MCVSWRERIFALDKANHSILYFRTDEAFAQHSATGAATQAGTIMLANAVLYVADYVRYTHTHAHTRRVGSGRR